MALRNPNTSLPTNHAASEAEHAMGAAALNISFNSAAALDPRNRGEQYDEQEQTTVAQQAADAFARRAE